MGESLDGGVHMTVGVLDCRLVCAGCVYIDRERMLQVSQGLMLMSEDVNGRWMDSR